MPGYEWVNRHKAVDFCCISGDLRVISLRQIPHVLAVFWRLRENHQSKTGLGVP